MQESDESVVKLVSVVNELKATIIVNALSSVGIEAKTTGGLSSDFKAEAPGYVNVLIHQKDMEQAKGVLQDLSTEFTDDDWDHVDVGDPVE